MTTQGRRLADVERGKLPEPWPSVGDYWREVDGETLVEWWVVVPSAHPVPSACPGHNVVEHEDGTITVSPSLLVHYGDGEAWHGFLERGIFREV